jgi:exodeoxyribonuclease VII small subunit
VAKKSSNSKTDIDFEASLRELEELVEKMEQGDLSLEQSLKDFERGIALTRACQQALREAEQKVQILAGNSEEAELAPFEGGEE